MIQTRPILVIALLAAALGVAAPATAQEEGAGPPFETLVQLAGTLGEAHAIRALCSGDSDQTWRNYMQNLLDLEAADGGKRSALTSAFNRGYRSQSSRHSQCTAELNALEGQIAARGRALADAVAQSYLD
jgi:uncharacterized protein (TIGR02301 family)